MGRLLSASSADSEVAGLQPSLSAILTEEILQVDRQLVEIQTATDELSGIHSKDLAVEQFGNP
jgi:chaperonin cofactor prefoldin